MVIEINLFLIITVLFLFNIILTHLLNWGYRELSDGDGIVAMLFLDMIRIVMLITILANLLL